MITLLDGAFSDKNPAKAVVICGGVGYECRITAKTYEDIQNQTSGRLLIQSVYRETTGTELFGFSSEDERTLFNLLVSHVSGVGAKTAIAILNGLGPNEFRKAVTENSPETLAKAKGVGKKVAERVILELRDKIQISEVWEAQSKSTNPKIEEAILALMALGQAKGSAEKAVKTANKDLGEDATLEAIIKAALRTP